MSKHQTGVKNGMWKGGRTITKHGYVLIRVGKEHPLADIRGYAYEHRVIAAQKLGRALKPDEIVHHQDGNTQNNNPDNLKIVLGIVGHRFVHRTKESNKRKPGELNPDVTCACGCGRIFKKFDRSNRPRRFVSGHNMRTENND